MKRVDKIYIKKKEYDIMITVDEVYPIDINTTIGPTGTIKRLFRNRDYFRERGYEMTIFACVPVKKRLLTYDYQLQEIVKLPEEKDSGIMADTINAPGKKNQLKSKLKTLVETNRFTSAAMLNRRSRENKKLISMYMAMKRSPDIVVFHELDGCYNYHKMNNGRLNAKTAMFIHADGTDDGMFRKSHPSLVGTPAHRKLLKKLEFTYQRTDRIVFISELARQRFCDAHPEYALKAVSVVNGIDDMAPVENAVPSSDYKYRLVSTGSVCKRKGQYLVVEAMHRMSPEVLKDTHFTIIGTGPDYSELQGVVEEYGLKEHVTFAGNKPNKEIHCLLARENIYILMSNNEGLPISILEAMRAGLPVISTRVAGIPEEVDSRNGELVYPDVDQLTEVLNRLPEYDWGALGRNSRNRFEEEFTFARMREKYAALFDGMK